MHEQSVSNGSFVKGIITSRFAERRAQVTSNEMTTDRIDVTRSAGAGKVNVSTRTILLVGKPGP
jgi:hypothetical protein